MKRERSRPRTYETKTEARKKLSVDIRNRSRSAKEAVRRTYETGAEARKKPPEDIRNRSRSVKEAARGDLLILSFVL